MKSKSILLCCCSLVVLAGCALESAHEMGYECSPMLREAEDGEYFQVGSIRCYREKMRSMRSDVASALESCEENIVDCLKNCSECDSSAYLDAQTCLRYQDSFDALLENARAGGTPVSAVDGDEDVSRYAMDGDSKHCPISAPYCVFEYNDANLVFECIQGCPKNMELCGKECVDLKTNVNHCGACGNSCSVGVPCVDGECKINECRTGQIICNGVCVDPLTSSTNCLAKGHCSDDNPESENYKGFACTAAKEVCLTWGEGDNLQGKCAISDCSGEETLCATNSNEGNKCIYS